MIDLSFTNESDVKVDELLLAERAEIGYEILKDRIDKTLKGGIGHISLALVGDDQIHFLNKEYRGKDVPTDVLSFAYLEVADFKRSEDFVVGDIFISVDTAKKQAKAKNHSLEKELEILFVHGFLHLFGFDHGNDKEEKEMEKWAKKILESS